MTCIVGIEHKGKVYLGADSMASNGHSANRTLAPKVFRNGEFVMGYTSSFRFGQLLEHGFKPPEQTGKDEYKYMCTEFVTALRECLRKGGYASVDNNVERGGNCLIGYRGRLYELQDDFSVLRGAEACAVGSGEMVAMGALWVQPQSTSPHVRLRKALEAAEEFVATVRGPFHFVASK